MNRIVVMLALLCAPAFCDDRVTVIIDGQRVTILNGEDVIRKHGLQRGMDIIHDRAKMILKEGSKKGSVIQ